LIDAGSSKFPERGKKAVINKIVNTIVREVRNKQLQIIISHPDKDHINLISGILNGLTGHKFIYGTPILGGRLEDYQSKTPKISETAKDVLYKQALKLSKLGGSCYFGTSFENAHHMQKYLQQLFPLLEVLASNPNESDNNKSIVLRYTMPLTQSSFFIGGDAGYDILKNISSRLLHSQVYLSNHHGADSHNSNCTELISKINPTVAVFSANSLYQHPRHNAMCNSLQKIASKNLVTPARLVTYGHSNENPITFSNAAGQVIKTILRLSDGFDVAITTFPLFTTRDSGAVEVYESMTPAKVMGFGVRSLEPELTIADCYYQAFTKNWNNITEIDLSDTGAADLLLALGSLPRCLHYLNVSNNRLSLQSLCSIFPLITSLALNGNGERQNWFANRPQIKVKVADLNRQDSNYKMTVKDADDPSIPTNTMSVYTPEWILEGFIFHQKAQEFRVA